jgi:hypothetical protein
MRYEATIRNLTFGQAQALYRLSVNLADEEPMHGSEGMTWSGIIPGHRHNLEPRTITIQPMIGEK